METSTNSDMTRGSHPHPDGRPVDVASRLQLFWTALIGTVLVLQLPLPFRLAGVLLCLAAIWLAISVLARLGRARRHGVRARRAWPVAVGLGLAGVMLLSFVSDAALYPIISQREQCLAGANTSTAQQQCMDQAQARYQRILDNLNKTK